MDVKVEAELSYGQIMPYFILLSEVVIFHYNWAHLLEGLETVAAYVNPQVRSAFCQYLTFYELI